MVFQVYGIYIMWAKSPKPMEEYGKILASLTIFDLVFTFVLGIFFAPALFFPVPGMYITGIGEDLAKALGHEVNKICVSGDLFLNTLEPNLPARCIFVEFGFPCRKSELLLNV